MTFKIGDEEFTEVNTSYDQEQEIGGSPNHYPAVGAEPIDAKNGSGFMDIGKLDESYSDHECKLDEEGYRCVCETCDTDSNEYNSMSCKTCKRSKGFLYGEKLNKDGTGTARAVRGIDPNNKKHGVMKFDYVSQAGCKICSKYDGKTWSRDSPNRPIIPRFESQGKKGTRPYTHPNCKCRWVKVFNEVHDTYNMESNEVSPELLKRANKWYGDGFEELKPIEKQMVVIKMLKTSLSMEKQAEEFDIVDPVPLASMAVLAFNAIKPNVKQKLGLEYAGQPKASPYNFGIQSMLDNMVGKGLHETKKKEIISKVNSDFTLENLLTLTANALADKLGKKLGVESKANEGGRGSGKKGHQPWFLGAEVGDPCENCMVITEREDGKCTICGN